MPERRGYDDQGRRNSPAPRHRGVVGLLAATLLALSGAFLLGGGLDRRASDPDELAGRLARILEDIPPPWDRTLADESLGSTASVREALVRGGDGRVLWRCVRQSADGSWRTASVDERQGLAPDGHLRLVRPVRLEDDPAAQLELVTGPIRPKWESGPVTPWSLLGIGLLVTAVMTGRHQYRARFAAGPPAPAAGGRQRASGPLRHVRDRLRSQASGRGRIEGDPDHFIANLGHDLRTPIAVALAEAQILRRTDGTGTDLRNRAVESIEQELWRLARLVDSLLMLGRCDRGSESSVSTIDFTEIVLDGVSRHGPAARIAEVGLRPHLELRHEHGGLPHLRGDETRIRMMVDHLVRRAIEATPRGGAVDIHLRSVDVPKRVLLLVRDGGPRPRYTDLRDILDHYHESPRQAGRAEECALSLLFCRTVAERHGGTARIRSPEESEDHSGTTIEVALPVVSAPDPLRT